MKLKLKFKRKIDFFKKLDTNFSLTPNERKMCAFLKLNMTTKEIIAITGQSYRSIVRTNTSYYITSYIGYRSTVRGCC